MRMVATLLGARAGALAGARVGERRGRGRLRPARCSPARSPTAATSSRAPRSSARDLTQRGGRDLRARRAACGADGRLAGPSAGRRAARAAGGERRLRSAGEGEPEASAAEVSAIVPADDDARLDRARRSARRASWRRRCPGSRSTSPAAAASADPVDLYRAGQEALLAANVGEAEGARAARLRGHRLLPAAAAGDERGPGGARALLRGDGRRRWSAYDDQYETDLVATVEAYLENDGNVAATAEQLFTHRHTVRYRLERVRSSAATTSPPPRGARSSASG